MVIWGILSYWGGNKSNIDDWAFTNEDDIILNRSQQRIVHNNTIYNIWGKGEWLEDYFKEVYPSTPDGINCSEHQVKFKLIGEPPDPPTKIIVLDETAPYIIYPATNARDL